MEDTSYPICGLKATSIHMYCSYTANCTGPLLHYIAGFIELMCVHAEVQVNRNHFLSGSLQLDEGRLLHRPFLPPVMEMKEDKGCLVKKAERVGSTSNFSQCLPYQDGLFTSASPP